MHFVNDRISKFLDSNIAYHIPQDALSLSQLSIFVQDLSLVVSSSETAGPSLLYPLYPRFLQAWQAQPASVRATSYAIVKIGGK